VRILGVDPGLTRCGLGVIEAGASRRVALVDVVVATSTPGDEVPQRLAAIASALDAVLDAHRPDAIAIERIFAQLNVRTVMGTAQVSGIVMLAAERRGIPVALYTPSEVKAAVTGSGRAAKPQVGQMVRRLLGEGVPSRPADAADALAIAICHAWRGAVAGAGTTGAETRAGRGARAGAAVSDRGARGREQGAGDPGSLATPAQARWAEAERAARRTGTKPRVP
jgi:crossover junction endodeoxyribonuclease RuvC